MVYRSGWPGALDTLTFGSAVRVRSWRGTVTAALGPWTRAVMAQRPSMDSWLPVACQLPSVARFSSWAGWGWPLSESVSLAVSWLGPAVAGVAVRARRTEVVTSVPWTWTLAGGLGRGLAGGKLPGGSWVRGG